MPNRDGTGPAGRGPMTGRHLGNCNKSNQVKSNMNLYTEIITQILSGIVKVFNNRQLKNCNIKQIDKE